MSDPGDPVVVPEPSTLALIGSGLLGYALLRRRRSPRPSSEPGTLPPRPSRLDDPS
ncbi:MAG: PEP-CTERM sorting domain-containing protein [Alphaproteobacteria bacterium]|nr:PEP-CTERM sorting domain-containing protein [Alphaproteobacteria bacterium]